MYICVYVCMCVCVYTRDSAGCENVKHVESVSCYVYMYVCVCIYEYVCAAARRNNIIVYMLARMIYPHIHTYRPI